ncbi:hypothetical protein SDC9_132585 [bioreactor metagenome]|uniref:Uncharacterized protein n=1 Tax=bioreactor metagenome TaxID=1076179 RepID=A0A645D829_9ZZZZ
MGAVPFLERPSPLGGGADFVWHCVGVVLTLPVSLLCRTTDPARVSGDCDSGGGHDAAALPAHSPCGRAPTRNEAEDRATCFVAAAHAVCAELGHHEKHALDRAVSAAAADAEHTHGGALRDGSPKERLRLHADVHLQQRGV